MNKMNQKRLTGTSVLLICFLLLYGCGGGGGSSTTQQPLTVSGTVLAPNGQIAVKRKPSLLNRLAGLFTPIANAAVSGLLPVPDGTEVELVTVTDIGTINTVLDSTTTSGGKYSFNLAPLGLNFSNDLAVLVSGQGRQMRAFVVSDTVDIDPLSEAAVRVIFEQITTTPGASLENFTVEELDDLTAGIDLLTTLRGHAAQAVLETTVANIQDAVAQDPAIQAFLAAAANTGQTSEGVGDIENLFPIAQGNVLNFRGSVSADGAEAEDFFNAVRVMGTKDIDGVTTTVVTTTNPSNEGTALDEFLVKNSLGITHFGDNDPDDFITPQLVPFQDLTFPLQIGSTIEVLNRSGLDWLKDLDGDGSNESAAVTLSVTTVGTEGVTVQVGTFPKSLRLDIEILFDITLSADGSKVTVTGAITQWQSPGIGSVKVTSQAQILGPGGTFNETETEELIGFQINGVGRGILPRFTIASDLVSADSDESKPGRPAIGSDGNNYLVVSCRESGAPNGIIGVLVRDDGSVSDPFLIAQRNDCLSPTPAVGFDGTNYLVAFQRDGMIFGVRISPSGEVRDGGGGFAISSGVPFSVTNFSPSVAFDGTNYLVVFGKFASGNLWDIYGARVTQAGQVLDELLIFTASGDQRFPVVAFDGVNYFVVWEDTRSGSGPTLDTDVFGARVSPAGLVLDPAGIPIATAAGFQGAPRLGFDGTNYFVVWQDIQTSLQFAPPVSSIFGRRISSNGVLLDSVAQTSGIAINTTPLGKEHLTATFDGKNYFVVWKTGAFSNEPPAGIFAARVSTAGTLLDTPADSEGLPITGLPSEFSRLVFPTILFNGTNSLLVWANNIELAGTQKSLEGVFVFPF